MFEFMFMKEAFLLTNFSYDYIRCYTEFFLEAGETHVWISSSCYMRHCVLLLHFHSLEKPCSVTDEWRKSPWPPRNLRPRSKSSMETASKKEKKKSKQIKSKISFTPKAAKVIRSERGLAGPPTASDVTQVISWSLGYFARWKWSVYDALLPVTFVLEITRGDNHQLIYNLCFTRILNHEFVHRRSILWR